MKFEKKDLVLLTGYKETKQGKNFSADIFEVCFVGLEELVVVPISGYKKSAFKIKKTLCEKIVPKKESTHERALMPRIGSLVVFWESDWEGKVKKHGIGHVQEIHDLPGQRLHYLITSNNITHEIVATQTLLLEL